MRGSRAMRLWMGGLRSPQRNRTVKELNGSGTATSMDGDRRHYQHPWPTSSGASVRRNGRRPASGLSPESRTPDSTPNASGRPRVPDARKSAETHCRPVLPAEDRVCPYGYSPEVGQTAGGRLVLVVLPIQTDPGALVPALQPMASQHKAMWAKDLGVFKKYLLIGCYFRRVALRHNSGYVSKPRLPVHRIESPLKTVLSRPPVDNPGVWPGPSSERASSLDTIRRAGRQPKEWYPKPGKPGPGASPST